MESSKFATMLNKNTNNIRVALVYAALEMVLIVLLFLNAIFSYLIIKFADYFRLKRPCLWCSRIDHIFEPKKFRDSFRSLVCEDHAMEISKLGYCLDHKRLAEVQSMCEDCLNSSNRIDFVPEQFSLVSWMNHTETVENLEICDQMNEKRETPWSCSCCGGTVENKLFFPDCDLIGCVLNDSDKHLEGSLIHGLRSADENVENSLTHLHTTDQIETRHGEVDTASISVPVLGNRDDSCCSYVHAVKDGDDGTVSKEFIQSMAICEDIGTGTLEYMIDTTDCHLIPVHEEDNFDSSDVHVMRKIQVGNEPDLEFEKVETSYELIVDDICNIDEEEPLLLLPVIVEKVKPEDLVVEHPMQSIQETIVPSGVEERLDKAPEKTPSVCAETVDMICNEKDDVVSIITEIPDQKQVDDDEVKEVLFNTSCNVLDEHGKAKKDPEFETVAEESDVLVLKSNSQPVFENPEDMVPDTPNSIDGFHHLHKKIFFLERRESCTEESFEGSILSDMDGSETFLTIENLKSALKTERKALQSLYAELEEERNASAVAANHTMAMINRLQKEKAAVQMEALQYQRMMEEQTEYDQEALQLLNELMLKREREKDELEKELVFYRSRVEDFESREQMVISKKRKGSNNESGTPTSSSSFSNSEIRDETFAQESNLVDEGQEAASHGTPADAVVFLENSMKSFESERLAILEQLKVLEGRLFIVGDEQYFEDIKPIEYTGEGNENGHCEVSDLLNRVPNDVNGKRCLGRKSIGFKAKRLLPYFDSVEIGAENGSLNGHVDMEDGPTNCLDVNGTVGDTKFDHRKLAIEEEMEHVYDRLYALEADREFLKHCVFSLRKGEKGVEVLQEILQHLRDLRSEEFRVRLSGEDSLDLTENKLPLTTSS